MATTINKTLRLTDNYGYTHTYTFVKSDRYISVYEVYDDNVWIGRYYKGHELNLFDPCIKHKYSVGSMLLDKYLIRRGRTSTCDYVLS